MGDLVDYLRDKLEHADDAVCGCFKMNLSTWDRPHRYLTVVDGCPIHDKTLYAHAAHCNVIHDGPADCPPHCDDERHAGHGAACPSCGSVVIRR